MSQEDRPPVEGQSDGSLKDSSDEFTEGVSKTASGISGIAFSLWEKLGDYWYLRWVLAAIFSAVAGGAGLAVLAQFHAFFFGAIVPASEIRVGTFPLPVGLTLWILSIGLIFVSLLMYFRMVALRQRIEELEVKDLT